MTGKHRKAGRRAKRQQYSKARIAEHMAARGPKDQLEALSEMLKQSLEAMPTLEIPAVK